MGAKSDPTGGLVPATDVERRTRLHRNQLRYYEVHGFLGTVARVGRSHRRAYTEEQVTYLERITKLRAAGLSLEQAAAIAAEGLASLPVRAPLSGNRLTQLFERLEADAERLIEAVCLVHELRLARRPF